MDIGFTTAAYLVAAVLFILSLGGLSGQESAKRAVWYGIVGMALAVSATLIGPGSGLWLLSLVLIAIGGYIGMQLAQRVQMTQMPELVAAMHSLVGLAAVFVGFNADFEIENVRVALEEGGDGISALTGFAAVVAKKTAVEINILRVELFLGIFIGAITFTGSVVAYGKLAGRVNSKAVNFRWPCFERGGGVDFSDLPDMVFQFRSIPAIGHHDNCCALYRLASNYGYRWSRYACCCLNAQFLLGLGSCGNWLFAWQRSFDCGWCLGRVIWCDLKLHYVQGNESLFRIGDPWRLWWHSRATNGRRR